MKILTFIFSLLLVTSAFGLTSNERKVAEHAKSELILTQKSLQTSRQETQAAENDANAAQASADLANQKADAAVAQIKTDIAKFKGHWGLNAIAYGFKELFGHLLILAIILVVIGVLVTIFVPAARPIFSMVTSFFSMLWARLMSLFTPKPKP